MFASVKQTPTEVSGCFDPAVLLLRPKHYPTRKRSSVTNPLVALGDDLEAARIAAIELGQSVQIESARDLYNFPGRAVASKNIQRARVNRGIIQ